MGKKRCVGESGMEGEDVKVCVMMWCDVWCDVLVVVVGGGRVGSGVGSGVGGDDDDDGNSQPDMDKKLPLWIV